METPAVICDGQITMGEAAKLSVEVESARLAVAENWVSTARQASRAEMAPAEMVSARSSEMDPRIQDFTTQSMRARSGWAAATEASERM